MSAALRVDVWFDPSCPWTWTTTRWLVEQVAPERPLDLRWHQMSLALLNEGNDVPAEYAEKIAAGRRTGRLLTAAVDRHGEQVLGALYTAVGERLFRQEREVDAEVAAEALAEAGLDADLVGALDDPRWDEAVRPSHEASQAAVGEPSGSPVVQLEGRALFGPVITPLPRGQEALDVFEGLRLLAASPSFSELKRPRSGPPDAG